MTSGMDFNFAFEIEWFQLGEFFFILKYIYFETLNNVR